MALVKWMSLHPILGRFFKHIPQLEDVKLFHHSPNGGMRNRKTYTTNTGKTYTYSPEGLTLKRMGTQAGFPDIFIPVPADDGDNGQYHGLFIELKPTFGGLISISQKMWLESMNYMGYKAMVCRGFDQAVYEIEKYLMGFNPNNFKKIALNKKGTTINETANDDECNKEEKKKNANQ